MGSKKSSEPTNFYSFNQPYRSATTFEMIDPKSLSSEETKAEKQSPEPSITLSRRQVLSLTRSVKRMRKSVSKAQEVLDTVLSDLISLTGSIK